MTRDDEIFEEVFRNSAQAIVAKLENGRLVCSAYPMVHPNVDAAKKEAARLANNIPNVKFFVLVPVCYYAGVVTLENQEVDHFLPFSKTAP